ncbi:MAG: GNAT family N-acetyltransferase [Kofleriaceae bacterium]|nr:GNAT family N-acetyltransferase [Kofleriaceae bacterium]
MADRVSIVEGGSDLVGAFTALTDEVYAEVDAATPGRPTSGRFAALLDDAQPSRRRCSLRLFLAPGRARAAAIVNPRLVGPDGKPIGLIGFFESRDDEPAATAVLTAATDWLHERGATIVRGPINFTTWHDYRLVTDAPEPGWFTGEPSHPAYYPRLWRAAGFTPASAYGSYWMPELGPLHDRFLARAERAADAGVTVRPVSVGDLPAVYQLSMIGFRDAHMFSQIEPDEFAALYGADRAASVASTSFLAVDDGRPVGFLYTFMTDLPRGRVGVAKSIAIRPEARDRGVYHALFAAAIGAFRDHDAVAGIAALIHIDGEPAKMGWQVPDRRFKTYELFERP